MIKNNRSHIFFAVLIIAILACNAAPTGAPVAQPQILPTGSTVATSAPMTATADVPTASPTVAVVHTQIPSMSPPGGTLIYDVDSSLTASEKRAPYGDSYNINRLERPFMQDMTYISDLDIVTYSVIQDDTWFYVSIKLTGKDPNNSLGINYGVELDTNHDGFGDFIIWAQPPYTSTWDTANVKIFADKNHNTAGLSSDKSDAPFIADGYEAQIFNGGVGDADPDMAWVRTNVGADSTLQFAFEKSWSGTIFMLGVIADAGLKDVTKLDYVDRFTEEEAGSPVKGKKYYPLKALFAVDNTCQEAFGFNPTGDESKLCPRPDAKATKQPDSLSGCQPPNGKCPSGYYWWPAPHCACSTTPYP